MKSRFPRARAVAGKTRLKARLLKRLRKRLSEADGVVELPAKICAASSLIGSSIPIAASRCKQASSA